MRTPRTLAVGALVALALTGCAKEGTQVAGHAIKATSTPVATTDAGNFPEPDPSELAVTPTPEETTTTDAPTEGTFGDTGSFTIDEEPFLVTVNPGVKARCKYDGMCSKPKTGDRVVNVPIIVKNNGKTALEMDPQMFALEFADGTRVTSTDGSAYEYGPDNVLDYGQKVRVGGTLKTSLTFEAPKGAYKVVLLSSSYNGDDLFVWK